MKKQRCDYQIRYYVSFIKPTLIFLLMTIGFVHSTLADTIAAVGSTPGSFEVSESGAATYTIPITVPPGTAGMAPNLSLTYNSQGGNGILGIGWSLTGLSSISRCPASIAQDGFKSGINYNSKDRFCLDGQRLVVVNGDYGADGTEYGTETESYSRIISYGTAGSGPAWFKVWTKAGQIMEYGNTDDSRIEAQGRTDVRQWGVNKISDTKGNYWTAAYTEDNANGEAYVSRIDYTGNESAGVAPYASVQFYYETRTDDAPRFIAGSKLQITKRLKSIKTFTDTILAKEYSLTYSEAPTTNRTRLISLNECDKNNLCLNSTNFIWQEGQAGFDEQSKWDTSSQNGAIRPYWTNANGHLTSLTDVNDDGLLDRAFTLNYDTGQRGLWIALSNGNGFDAKTLWLDEPTENNWNQPELISDGSGSVYARLQDMNGDGLPDRISIKDFSKNIGGLFVALNNGNSFSPKKLWWPITTGNQHLPDNRYEHGLKNTLVDMNGDSLPDHVSYYNYNTSESGLWVALNNGSGFDSQQLWFTGMVDDARDNMPLWVSDGSNSIYANLIDMNGDGLPDRVSIQNAQTKELGMWVAINNGQGFDDQINWWKDTTGNQYFSWNRYEHGIKNMLTDMNGDGLPDNVMHYNYDTKQNGLWVALNTGNGFDSKQLWFTGMVSDARDNMPLWISDGSGNTYANLQDVNGDGLPDRIATRNAQTKILGMWVSINNGKGFGSQMNWWPNTIGNLYFPESRENNINGIYHTLTDINGDGILDHAAHYNYNKAQYGLWVARGRSKPDLITAITNGNNFATNIEYLPLTDSRVHSKDVKTSYPTRNVSEPIYIVSKTLTTDAIGGNYETHYTYVGAKLHQTGGGFLGFEQVTSKDSQTGIATTTIYRLDYPNQGLPQSVEKKTQEGQLLNQIQNTWQNTSLGAGAYHRSDLTETVEQSWDLNGAAMPRTKTSTEYDDYGNATKIIVATDDSYSNEPIGVKLTQNTYSNDSTNWLLGRLTRATVTSTLPTGASATRTSSFAYAPNSGLLVQEVIEPDEASLRLVTDYTLDSFGNRVVSTVSGNGILTRSSTTNYDPQGRFPTASTNALGHTETRSYDPAFGNPLSMTGPNGLTTTWIYDGFGRKIQENRPDGTLSSQTYAWCDAACPANAVYTIATIVSGGPDSTAYFDSLNRQIRIEKVGFDGRISIQDTQYDNMGRAVSSSQPYYEGDNVTSTHYQYDILGRVIQVTAPDNGITKTEYSGLVTTVTNALGRTSQEEKNGLGQLIKVTDALNSSMLFAYDPFGNLNETTDPHNNKIVIEYDLRGHKIAMHDPDMGNWSYSYNVLGELLGQKNAKGQITKLSYDKLGRMIQRNEMGLSSKWQWDKAAMGKGKLASFSSNNLHKRDYEYDEFGRTKSVKTKIGNSVFTISTEYDGFSRVLKTTYPTGFAVSNGYNFNGYLAEVRDETSEKPFWQATTVDAAGRVTEELLGNGLVTQRNYDLMGRTIGIRTQPFTGATLQDLSLTWDLVGNLTNRDDNVTTRSDQFDYDELNRLKSASYSDGKNLSFEYDAIGNIIYQSDVGDYSYGARPHAVTKIAGTLNSTFVYDSNGNQTKGLDNRTISYTSWDMPAKMTQGSATLTFAYDANHERFRQISPTSTTYYINPRIDQGAHFEQIITPIGGATFKKNRHYIYAGSQVIGELMTFNSGTKETRYFHSDHLGSINTVTDDNGKIIARYDYQPFGKQTQLQGDTKPIQHGFTGHEHLPEVGLIHMNGRVYDPITSRFLSADPTLQLPNDIQNYNRYSYVMNNPLAFTDPSGYGIGKFFKNAWRNDIVRAVAAIAASAITGQIWAPYGSSAFGLFAKSVASGFVGGAVQTGNLNGAVHGAFTAGLFYGAGEINQGISSLAGKTATHAVVGCISASVSGGNCGKQALSAGFAKTAGPYTQGFGEIGNLVAHSVVGGTGSVIGGGKFSNGAVTGAYGYLFNDCNHEKCNVQEETNASSQKSTSNYWFDLLKETLPEVLSETDHLEVKSIGKGYSAPSRLKDILHIGGGIANVLNHGKTIEELGRAQTDSRIDPNKILDRKDKINEAVNKLNNGLDNTFP